MLIQPLKNLAPLALLTPELAHALIVERVCASGMISSPGRARATSTSVAPRFRRRARLTAAMAAQVPSATSERRLVRAMPACSRGGGDRASATTRNHDAGKRASTGLDAHARSSIDASCRSAPGWDAGLTIARRW